MNGTDLANAIRNRQILRRDLPYYTKWNPDMAAYDSSGRKTAFLWAVHYGQVFFAEKFIDMGADIQQKTGLDRRDAVSVAASQGHLDMVEWLLARVTDLRHACADGKMCIHYAAESGNPDLLSKIILADPSLLHIKDGSGKTAYDIAVKCRDVDMVERIVELTVKSGAFDGGNPAQRPITVSKMRPRRKDGPK